jgi:phosphoribosylaminoimidazolecarboxamide formyltransferase/IMP cyclohydrolase
MKRALISVHHKEGIEKTAAVLIRCGWEILSTGGTAKHLLDRRIPVTEVSAVTGFPEILDGRVKTLHPFVFAPILAKDSAAHQSELARLALPRIDLVIVNFYPFAEALRQREKGIGWMLENVDIGGPSMVRAAAKNFQNVIVVVDGNDHLPVAETIEREGDISPAWRKKLAQKAFAYTSFYDSLIARYLQENQDELPPYQNISGRMAQELRYGENPHQKGAMYISDSDSPFQRLEQLQGKQLSFNNILDAAMVYETLNEFQNDAPFAVIVKHQNPCGAALNPDQREAFQNALAGDPKSAFGGIVGFNSPLAQGTAEAIQDVFFEVIIAPDFSAGALAILGRKKNLRLIRMPLGYRENADFKTIPGGFVYQSRDNDAAPADRFVLKTDRPIGEEEKTDIAFGWKLIKFVKSNGIILVRDRTLIGVGAGQMSRVDAVELAIRKSSVSLKGSILLSDAYFPFADSVEIAARHQIHVIVEPGGSIRDAEVIEAARRLGISLVFTGIRHFRH